MGHALRARHKDACDRFIFGVEAAGNAASLIYGICAIKAERW